MDSRENSHVYYEFNCDRCWTLVLEAENLMAGSEHVNI